MLFEIGGGVAASSWRSLNDFPVLNFHKENIQKIVSENGNVVLKSGIIDRFTSESDRLLTNLDLSRTRKNLEAITADSFESPEAEFFIIDDVYVHTGTWIIVDSNKRAFTETVPPWSRDTVATQLSQRYHSDRSAKGVTETIDEPVYIWGRGCLWNYCHWHYDCLASITMAESLIGGDYQYLVGPHLRTMSYFGPSLGAFGHLGSRLRDVEGIVHCRRVIVPSRSIGSVEPCRFLLKTFNDLKVRIAPGREGSRRIYIARFDAPGRREIINERDLAEALEKYGFEILVPGSQTYRRQVETLAEASTIIGPHGAGLTNIAFASETANFVEIHPTDYGQPTFTHLALAKGQKTHVYFVDPTEGAGQSASMQVDVSDFLDTLRDWKLI